MSSMETRVQRLEQSLRRSQAVNVGLLLCALAALIGGMVQARAPQIVDAERFNVRDASGKIVGSFGHNEAGSSLTLSDSAGRIRLSLMLINGAPFLGMCDATGRVRTQLSVAAEGAMLQFGAEKGSPQLNIGCLSNQPSIAVHDHRGTVRASFGLIDSISVLSLNDEDGKQRVGCHANKNRAMIELNDLTERPSVIIAHSSSGPIISLQESGIQRVGLSVLERQPALSFFDATKANRAQFGLREAGSPFLSPARELLADGK